MSEPEDKFIPTDANVAEIFERAVLDGTVFGVEPTSMHRIVLHYSVIEAIRKAITTYIAALPGAAEPVAWQQIERPNKPDEADYEREQLQKRIAMFGPEVVSDIVSTYALSNPKQGSLAGSLWAIAEWCAMQTLSPPANDALACSALIGLPASTLEHLKLVGFLQDDAIGKSDVELGSAAALDHPLVRDIDTDDLERLSDPVAILAVIERRLERGALPVVVHGPGVECLAAATGNIIISHRVAPSVELGTIQATMMKHIGRHLTNISFISSEILFYAVPPANDARLEEAARVADNAAKQWHDNREVLGEVAATWPAVAREIAAALRALGRKEADRG